MTRNAEFQRQLWLNCSASTILWILGLCTLLMAVPWVISGPHLLAPVAYAGLWCATLGYGPLLAANSMHQELRHNTWDWQRLSALTPWQMSCGKWLGATSPAWLIAACFATANLLVGPQFLSSETDWRGLGLAVLWGMAAQVWAINLVMLGWRTNGVWGWRKAILLPWLLLILVPGTVLSSLWQQLHRTQGVVTFWGTPISIHAMAALLGCACLVLGLLALWRQMAQRLDIATLPWAWPLGLIALALVLAGLSQPSWASSLSWISYTALLGTAYIALHSVQTARNQWLHVHWHTTRRQWEGALQAFPLWPISWLLGMLTAGMWSLTSEAPNPILPFQTGWLLLLIGFQLLRDSLLLTGFALLESRLKSPITAFALAWLVFNVLLPLLVWGGAGSVGPVLARGLQPLLGYALIMSSDIPAWVFFTLMLVQVGLVAAWVAWVFRRHVAAPVVHMAD